MIVAIDTNCILPGRVGGIENYTLALIQALKLPGSPASNLLLLTRPENQELFSRFTDAHTQSLLLDRPLHRGTLVDNWASLLVKDPIAGRETLSAFQQQKTDLLRRHRADLVHFPGNTINPLELGLPAVLNLHDLQHRHFPEYFTPEEIENREKWWTSSAHRADALMAASEYVRRDLVDQLHVNGDKIFVTPDVFESAFFTCPSAEQLTALRMRYQLPASFLLYPAAMWPHKNHERLIRAFLAAALPNTQLILTGGGQEESPLPQLIEDLCATRIVRLLGRVSTDELVGLYHLATGMIFPSQHESWSIPIMEAMACGCPVACSNVTSLPEEIGDAGLLFSPEDAHQITTAIRQLCEDEPLRHRLSDRGRQRVKQFSTDNFLATITAAYGHARTAFCARRAA